MSEVPVMLSVPVYNKLTSDMKILKFEQTAQIKQKHTHVFTYKHEMASLNCTVSNHYELTTSMMPTTKQ